MTDEHPRRTAPYVGLEPFDEEDQAFFFGRDQEAVALADEILANPITILFAPSGAGKSSLLRVRIIPDMRKLEAVVVYVSQWLSPPVASVRSAVAKAIGPAIAGGGERSLLALAQALHKETGQGLVLVLDQFEQFFLHHGDQVNAFGAELAALARAGRDAHLVFSLREEFLSRLDAFRETFLGIAQTRYRLGPLSEEHAREAIIKPLTVDPFRGAIEPDLVTKLLGDLGVRARAAGLTGAWGGDTGISLPILQIVCRHLWDASPGQLDRQLTVAHYDELDGYKGVIDAHVRETMKGVESDDRVDTANVLDRLAPRSGVKMAYNIDDLTQQMGIARARLDARLTYLDQRRVVHFDRDGQVVELFHDAYTEVLRGFIDEVLEGARREAERRQQEVDRKAARRRRNEHVGIAFGLAALLLAGACATVIYRARTEPARLAKRLHEVLVESKTCASITDAVQTLLAETNSKVSWAAKLYSPDRDDFFKGLFKELVNNADSASRCPELRTYDARIGVTSPVDVGSPDTPRSPVVLRYNALRSTNSPVVPGGNPRALELRLPEIQNLWQALVDRLWDEQQIALVTTISVVSDDTLPAWSYALEVHGRIVWRRPIPEQQDRRTIIEWNPPQDQENKKKHDGEFEKLSKHVEDAIVKYQKSKKKYDDEVDDHSKHAEHAMTKVEKRPSTVFPGISVSFVPAWSAPVWQHLGQRFPLEMVSGVEGSIAFDVSEYMAGQPELYLTEQLTRVMIALRQQEAPCLVYAALDRFMSDAPPERKGATADEARLKAFDRLMRHVHRALIEAARQRRAAGALTRILDRLADLPANSPEADPPAIAQWLEEDDGQARPPNPIMLSRKRQEWDCPHLSLSDMLGSSNSRYYYWDVAGKLDLREAPILVRVSTPLVVELADGPKLRPEVREMLYQVQHDLWAAFGVSLPEVRFTATTWPEARYRIEVPGRYARSLDSLVLPDLRTTLRDVIAKTRMATVTGENSTLNPDLFFEAKRPSLYRWIKLRFSRNDIKLLLRSVLAPAGGAIDASPPAPTIRNVLWLLGSLPFWELTCDRAENSTFEDPSMPGLTWFSIDECLIAGLRETQNAGRAGGPAQEVRPSGESIRSRIADGIRALDNDKPDEAVRAFGVAVREDRNQARQLFLHLYGASAADLARARSKALCGDVPAPGGIRKWGGDRRFERAQIEDAIDDAVEPQNREAERAHLQLCALMYQLPTTDEANDARKIQQFLKAHEDVRAQWTPRECYWLGYRLVDANARVRVPARPATADREAARSLLEGVFGDGGLDAVDRTLAFKDLLGVCGRNSNSNNDRCFWDLAEIAEKSPLSTNQLGLLVSVLSKLPTSGTKVHLDRLTVLVRHAMDGLGDITGTAQRERALQYWELGRLQIAILLRSYDDQGADKLLDEMDAFRTKVALSSLFSPQENSGLAHNAEVLRRDLLAHQGKIAEVRASIEEEKKSRLDQDLREDELHLVLREGKVKEKMVGLADNLLAASQWNNEDFLFLSAIAHLLVNDPGDVSGNAERLLLLEKHRYRDYVRLLLYWRLVQRGETSKASELLEQRRLEIPDPEHDDADARFAEGDLAPWRDLLVRYYIDPSEANRQKFLDPVKDRASFDASPLSRAGQSFSSFRCEAFFYDALRQSLTGEPATRRQRYVEQLTAVVHERCFDTYEYSMASWLLQQPATI